MPTVLGDMFVYFFHPDFSPLIFLSLTAWPLKRTGSENTSQQTHERGCLEQTEINYKQHWLTTHFFGGDLGKTSHRTHRATWIGSFGYLCSQSDFQSYPNPEVTPHVRSTFGSCGVAKVHPAAVRSTFRCQNGRNITCSGHFWIFRCRKSAPPHIWNSKCFKDLGAVPL